jgi:rubrerythrin
MTALLYEATMTQKLETQIDPELAEVLDLLQRRATVQSWLARLDEQRGSVSERVLERVRADYERRLRDTLDSLASHRRAIQDELERATSRLVAAEEEHEDAVDQLEEARLRNLIGEIEDPAWKDREPVLDETVREARDREAEVRAETERLRDLLEQLDDREPGSGAAPNFSLEATGTDLDSRPDGDLAEEVVEVEDVEEDEFVAETPEPAPVISAATQEPRGRVISKEESDAFLQEIDRSLSGAHETEVPRAADEGADETEEDTSPKPGLKCAECGYTNDLSAWFCGVCGADVG